MSFSRTVSKVRTLEQFYGCTVFLGAFIIQSLTITTHGPAYCDDSALEFKNLKSIFTVGINPARSRARRFPFSWFSVKIIAVRAQI